MFGKQANVLDGEHIEARLMYARLARHPARNEAMVLLSVKAGVRAAEIANLTWGMVLGPDGQIGSGIELHAAAAKNRSGRRIPMHENLREALLALGPSLVPTAPVIRSERGDAMRPVSIVHWFVRCLSRTRPRKPNRYDAAQDAAGMSLEAGIRTGSLPAARRETQKAPPPHLRKFRDPRTFLATDLENLAPNS